MAEKILEDIKTLFPFKRDVEDNVKKGEPSISALVLQSYESIFSPEDTAIDKTIDVVLDKTWEDLNTGHWSSVPLFRRYIYSIASLMMVLAKVKQASALPAEDKHLKLKEALKAADRGLLLGGQLHAELTKAAELLTLEIAKCNNYKVVSKILVPSPLLPQFEGVQGESITVLNCPSFEKFYSEHFNPRRPVKLKDCINHWPALTKWNDIGYLLRKAGERTVPVELGSKYDDSEWSQKLMKFQHFVEQHILIGHDKNEKGYLAQHQLFLQIPELKDDIREPEFCCCSDLKQSEINDADDEVDINAWFGPEGTVSPLHFDPKHNLLAQVVGRKRVILYDPKYSDLLSPHDSKLLSNTAQVDPENPDYKKYPSYKGVSALETILNPGEMLYIPPTWWHHVRSLDISFSVSFWW